ncbi:hypothetical protein C8R44DRAFT_752748 [Mycena epipterygia]|nr:hypothetical protein C8R44DRAFT_752748 [Mycena epipterygia]
MAWPPRPSRACILFGMSRSSPIGLDFWDKILILTWRASITIVYPTITLSQKSSPIGDDLDMPNRIHAREGRGGQAIKEKPNPSKTERDMGNSFAGIKNSSKWKFFGRAFGTANCCN